MGQLVVSWLAGNGIYRVYATNEIGRRRRRIVEIEVIKTGERFHGSAKRMQRLVQAVQGNSNDSTIRRIVTRP